MDQVIPSYLPKSLEMTRNTWEEEGEKEEKKVGMKKKRKNEEDEKREGKRMKE